MRRLLALVCFLAALGCLAVLALLVLDARRDSQPYALREQFWRTRIDLRAERTNVAFPGDCVQVTWRIYAARRIELNEHPFLATGERNLCDATPPTFEIETADGETLIYAIPRRSPFDSPLSWGLLFGVVVLGAASVPLSGVQHWRLLRSPLVEYGLVLVGVIAFVVVLDLFTNALDIVKYVWDHVHYIEMAQYGLLVRVGDTQLGTFQGLVAPFAYRPVTPLVAGLLGEQIGRSVIAGFRAVAYLGAISQLFLVYVLARQFTARFLPAFAALCVTAFALFNVKFLLFDIYRPDHLAFPLLLLAFLCLLRRWFLPVLLISAFGMLVREFLILPLALVIVVCAFDWWKTRRWQPLAWIGLTLAITAAAVVLPRALIVVARSSQLIDQNTLVETLLNGARHLNILFVLFSYLLPTLLLILPHPPSPVHSVHGGKEKTNPLQGVPLRLALAVYVVGVIGLTLYGGTDVMRFVPYLFIPQIILIARRGERAHPLEIVYMIVAVFVFNRVWMVIPQANLDAYFDFYGGWNDRVNEATLLRTLEMVAWIAGMWALRWGINLTQRHRGAEKIIATP